METETAKWIAERSNTGLVASVWRSCKNHEGSKVEQLKRTQPRDEKFDIKFVKED